LFDPSQVAAIWADRRDGYMIIDTEFMPSKLWVSVPELAWYADNTGVIWLRFDDACQLFLDLFSLHVVKGPNWPADTVPVSDDSPSPAALSRGWAVLLSNMAEANWETTTPALFSQRLKSIKNARLSPSEHAAFLIDFSDLEQITRLSLAGSDWHSSTDMTVQWFFCLTWDRGSIARYEDGSFSVLTMMLYIFCPCYCPEERDAGSLFQQFFLDVMVWFSSHSAIPTPANAFNTGASFLALGVSATQVVDALRYCADFPAIAKQHRPWGAMCCAWFTMWKHLWLVTNKLRELRSRWERVSDGSKGYSMHPTTRAETTRPGRTRHKQMRGMARRGSDVVARRRGRCWQGQQARDGAGWRATKLEVREMEIREHNLRPGSTAHGT
jgi:hypothetical protein